MMAQASNRSVHLVGSIPVSSTKDALALINEEIGEHLGPTIPDGQTGDRSNWVERIIEQLRGHPQLELARDGAWTDYSDIPVFRVRKGRRMRWVDLGYLDAFERSRPDLVEFATNRSPQIGIPTPAGLAYVAFGMSPARAAPNLATFREATIREISAIHTRSGGEAVFQLELPIEMSIVTRLPLAAREAMSGRLASELLRLVNSAPRGARFGLHLCSGDLNRRALAHPTDAGPAVLMANAIMAAWPPARTLEYVHIGLAPGSEAPSLDPDAYAPIKTLWIPPDVRFVGGFIHEKRSVEELVLVREEIEHLLERPIDVAASCGLGRRTLKDARESLRLAVAVATG